jgi:hypothetical protein
MLARGARQSDMYFDDCTDAVRQLTETPAATAHAT